MLDKLRHFALTHHKTVYDEEALSSLELVGRIGAKLNEIITEVNNTIELVEQLPAEVERVVGQEIRNGNIAGIVGPAVLDELGTALSDLNTRISRIVASSGQDNTEVVDMRTGPSGTYDTAGDHVRALADGSAFADAVRPGTVKHNRIMAGMLGGDLADDHTLQSAVPMAGKWVGYAYFDKTNNTQVSHTGYHYTEAIPCKYGDTFVLDSYVFGPRVYPAAVLNAGGQVIEVLGAPGKSNWDVIKDSVTVTRSDAAYIRFVCGVGYENQFRAYRVIPNNEPNVQAAMSAKGYLHMVAKNRTDTVTDRAQIKMWFKRPEPLSANDVYTIPLRLYKWANLLGYTFRVFASDSMSTYNVQLAASAAGYTFDPDKGIEVSFKAATEANGVTMPYVCLFIDFLPVNAAEAMDVCLPVPELNGVKGANIGLHGAQSTDYLRNVGAGVMGSVLMGKRILGLGDSLMRGNTLPQDASWFNLCAGHYDMNYHNAGVNGRSVAEMAENINATLAAFPKPDYFVLNGGANDLRLGVSIETFNEALISIIGAVRANNPMVKILALTNWQRSDYENDLGLIESDYVEAMLETCEALSVPCINNYADSLDLTDPATQSWADEGLVSTGTANLHFSREANIYMVPRIAAELERL